MLHKDPIMNY